MFQLLPVELQILHNIGIFQYNKITFIVFLIELLLFPLVLLLLLYLCYKAIRQIIYKKSFRFTKITILSGSICVLLIVGCMFSLKTVLSRVYFARGYKHYLNRRDDKASAYYLRSLEIDGLFIAPLNELITLFRKGERGLLSDIEVQSRNFSNSELFATVGSLYVDTGDFSKAIDLYRKAHNLSPIIDYYIDIIGILIASGNYEKAELELQGLRKKSRTGSNVNRLLYYRSIIYYYKGNLIEAKRLIDILTSEDTANPDYFVQKAKILAGMDRDDTAIRMYSKAVSLKRENPQVYFEMAKIYYSKLDFKRAAEMLEKTLYYDNTISMAHAMLRMIYKEKCISFESIYLDKNIYIDIVDAKREIRLLKGESQEFTLLINDNNSNSKADFFEVEILEPYGFGVRSKINDINKIATDDGKSYMLVTFNIEALRSSKVNLGHPWILNVVYIDLSRGAYKDIKISVTITNSSNEEGRILFVLTEDLEQTGDFPHQDETPDILDFDPYEIEIDLVKKISFADDIASEYGVKWSHMPDIGSTFLRLKWIDINSLQKDIKRKPDIYTPWFKKITRLLEF